MRKGCQRLSAESDAFTDKDNREFGTGCAKTETEASSFLISSKEDRASLERGIEEFIFF